MAETPVTAEQATANVLACLRLAKHDHAQRFVRDFEDASNLDEDRRQRLLSRRTKDNEVYARLYEVASKFGQTCVYSDEVDEFLRGRGASVYTCGRIAKKIEQGWITRMFEPDSNLLPTPHELIARALVENRGEASPEAIEGACRDVAQCAMKNLDAYGRRYAALAMGCAPRPEDLVPPPVAKRVIGGEQVGPPAWALGDNFLRGNYQRVDAEWGRVSTIHVGTEDVFRPDIGSSRRPNREATTTNWPSRLDALPLGSDEFPPAEVRAPSLGHIPASRAEKLAPRGVAGAEAAKDETKSIVEPSTPGQVAPAVIGSDKTAAMPSVVEEEHPDRIQPALPDLPSPRLPASPRRSICPYLDGDTAAAMLAAALDPKHEPDPDTISGLTKIAIRRNRKNWNEKTRTQVIALSQFLIANAGRDHYSGLSQSDVGKFRDLLDCLPRRHGKSSNDRKLSLAEICDKAKSLRTDQVGLYPGTINRYIVQLSSILSAAKSHSRAVADPKDLSELYLDDEVPVELKRAAFTEGDLTDLFKSEALANSDDDTYFTFALGPYSGMRLAEACGILTDDVDIDAMMINLKKNSERTLKNRPSRRSVPIHSELRRLGFIDFVKMRKAQIASLNSVGARDRLLFGSYATRGDSEAAALGGKSMTKLIDAALPMARIELKTYHSLRSYVNTQLTNEFIPDPIRKKIIGHVMSGANELNYIKNVKPEAFHRAIETLPVLSGMLKPREFNSK